MLKIAESEKSLRKCRSHCGFEQWINTPDSSQGGNAITLHISLWRKTSNQWTQILHSLCNVLENRTGDHWAKWRNNKSGSKLSNGAILQHGRVNSVLWVFNSVPYLCVYDVIPWSQQDITQHKKLVGEKTLWIYTYCLYIIVRLHSLQLICK